MEIFIENINQILAEWDPIGVGEDMARYEYRGYIPLILQFIDNKEHLMDCLEDILINKIGVDFDLTNKTHLEDLQRVCDKIIHIFQKQ